MDRSSVEGELATGREPESTALVGRCRELADVSFGAFLEAAGDARIQWATPDGREVVGRGVAAKFEATGPDRFESIRLDAAETFDRLAFDGPAVARPRAFGGVSFHDDHEPGDLWEGFENASFVLPAVTITRSENGTWLTAVDADEAAATDRLERWHDRLTAMPTMRPSGSRPGVAAVDRSTSPEAWRRQVEAARDRIAAGELTKVVLATSLSATLEEPVDVAATLERLRRRYPNCYRFLVDHGEGGTFFGAPPERLVSKRGNRVETEAVAGSAPRGESPEADEEYAARLRDAGKFRHEHGVVVDSIRAGLESLDADLGVGPRTIRRLATIQHLQTPIEATLSEHRHVLEIVAALHPTPAVGGVPREAARETIRATESFDRGWYAAPVGWFDADGDGEFAVGIRSGLAADETVTLFAGNGIVADSDPDEELEEVQLKFRPILDELE